MASEGAVFERTGMKAKTPLSSLSPEVAAGAAGAGRGAAVPVPGTMGTLVVVVVRPLGLGSWGGAEAGAAGSEPPRNMAARKVGEGSLNIFFSSFLGRGSLDPRRVGKGKKKVAERRGVEGG